ncbi:hypothetical protein HNR46_003174 [Haloferula luteola]|uniref:Uncharacterized protein n=1 Tax=Haloferula luteola TaxID=595692 RepID=A0A840V4I0_9BACT|nr:hypothetical protein [Haloferula luteola]MBB5352925.1 hypothetical protein [Haloferula luteola]
MKTLLAATLLLSPLLRAELLTDADRDQVLQRLDTFKEEAGQKASSRLGDASSALKNAMASDKAALELYLKCVEQADFIAAKRTSNDFRDWKRRNREWLESDGFGTAVRHQIRWLMLSLKASANPNQVESLGPEALECLEGIFRDPKNLAAHTTFLATPSQETLFAKAYGIQGDRLENWPSAPIQKEDHKISLAETFSQAIFPSYRKSKNFAGLRSAWDRRIHFEEVMAGFWTGDDRRQDKHLEELAEQGNLPGRTDFLRTTQPDLEWQKEMDLFQSGDQKKAVVALVEHLEQNVTHSKAREWEAELREALKPSDAVSP